MGHAPRKNKGRCKPLAVPVVTVTFLFTLLLSACAIGPQPRWFVVQGANISECGPAVAAMAERLFSGNNVTRGAVRSFHRQGVNNSRWWNLSIIKAYLDTKGVPNQWSSIDTPRKGIYFINHNHFVLFTGKAVADPLAGVNQGNMGSYNITYKMYIELL